MPTPRQRSPPLQFGEFDVLLTPPSEAGRQIPSDCNQDGALDLSDSVCFLRFLFLDTSAGLPCGDGSVTDRGNMSLLDCNGDDDLDLSDGVCILNLLFLGTQAHALGVECTLVEGCAVICDA